TTQCRWYDSAGAFLEKTREHGVLVADGARAHEFQCEYGVQLAALDEGEHCRWCRTPQGDAAAGQSGNVDSGSHPNTRAASIAADGANGIIDLEFPRGMRVRVYVAVDTTTMIPRRRVAPTAISSRIGVLLLRKRYLMALTAWAPV